jgi:hypothetical protein
MLRKLTLTGFLLLLPQSLSLVRLVAALVISVGHVLVLTIARPFRDSDHSTFLLALVASVGMCGVLLAALLIKLFNAIDASVAQQLFGMRDTFALVCVIAALEMGILMASALVLWRRIASDRAMLNARQLRRKTTNELVYVAACSKPFGYHLFLSHAWTTSDSDKGPGAQDQMRIVKQRLLETLCGCKVFLGALRALPTLNHQHCSCVIVAELCLHRC